MTELRVLAHGLRDVEDEVGAIVGRARNVRRTVPQLRERWLQSERRTFARGTFPRRETSTDERYRRRGSKSGLGSTRRDVSAPVGGPLVLSGQLRRGLTTPRARGQLTRTATTGDGLTVDFGVNGGRSPLAYALILARRNAARDPVEIDDRATSQMAGDVSDYILFGRLA